MRKILLLATDTDDTKIFLWCLREAGYQGYVLGNLSKNREIEYSPLCKKFFVLPENYRIEARPPQIVDFLRRIVTDEGIVTVLPTGFESIKYISQYSRELRKTFKVLPLPDLSTIDRLSNKLNFWRFCTRENVPHPKTYLLGSLSDIDAAGLKDSFPLMTKPIVSSAGRGIYKFENLKRLKEYLASGEDAAFPLLLQEFIPGCDYGFCGFATNGYLNAWTIMKFIEIPRADSKPLLWIQFQRNDHVLEIGKLIVKKENYSGPINIDMRLDERHDKVYALEVNTRFWARTFFSNCDGVNFADVAIRAADNPSYQKEPRYSGRIWGSPHRLLPLLLKHKGKKYMDYASRHTFFQIRYFFLDKWFTVIEKFRRIPKTIKIYRKDYGWWNLILKLFFKACPFFTYYETILYGRNLQSMSPSGTRPELDVSYGPLTETDYEGVIRIKNPDDQNFIEKRLAMNEQCFLAKDHDSICCYFWVAPGEREIEHEARMLRVGKDQIYIHDCFTVEQYRGMSILPHFMEQICLRMKKSGYQKALAVVYNDNYSSRRCFEKIGFQKCELTRHFAIPLLKKKCCIKKTLLEYASD